MPRTSKVEQVPMGFAADLAAMAGITAAIAVAVRSTRASSAARRRLRRLAITIEATAEAVAKEAGMSRRTSQGAVEFAVAAADNRFGSGALAGKPGPAFSVAHRSIVAFMISGEAGGR